MLAAWMYSKYMSSFYRSFFSSLVLLLLLCRYSWDTALYSSSFI